MRLSLLVLSITAAAAAAETGCSATRLRHGRVRFRQRARLARFACQPGYELVGNKYATCDNTTWDVPLPVCVRAGCEPLGSLRHGVRALSHRGAFAVFFCLPGRRLAGSPALYCDGQRWNATSPVCVDQATPPPLSCDFESSDWCGWRNDEFHDFDWRQHSRTTPSSFMNTGPSFDHTLGAGKAGHYLYVESTAREENDTARLLSPIFGASLTSGCFLFHYHMLGKTTGTLRVYQKPVSVDMKDLLRRDSPYKLFELSGNQGNRWFGAVVTLQPSSEDFQLVVEGVRGASYTSDMALDDVALLSGGACAGAAARVAADGKLTRSTVQQLDSCAGRCDSSELFGERGELFECGCSVVCLLDDSCCADFRDLCEFPDYSMMTSESSITQAEELPPQTMKLVADSPTPAPAPSPSPSPPPRATRVQYIADSSDARDTTTTTTARAATTTPTSSNTTHTASLAANTATRTRAPPPATRSRAPPPATVPRTTNSLPTQTKTTPLPKMTTLKINSNTEQPTRASLPATGTQTDTHTRTTTHANATTLNNTARHAETSATHPTNTRASAHTTTPPHTHTTRNSVHSNVLTIKRTSKPLHDASRQTGDGGWWWVGLLLVCVCVCVGGAAAGGWRRRRGRGRRGEGGTRSDEVRYLTSHDHLDIDTDD